MIYPCVLSAIMAEKPQATTENPAQQALEKLSKQLSCSVCLEEYRRPRVLPCLHVFCEACLEKLVGTQRDKLSAPVPQLPQALPLSLKGACPACPLPSTSSTFSR
ncbi:Tripartite motif-containing protein 2 [Geodia barretti]|uniref:Tripartite motif-containing protein 2 n=1 Tax=Geodia barretti TaxID=519541 RepID=A0AA35WM15_GEOBA|nr:Tripartite motif-containing protein 2 [Geodia barretti]